MKPLARSEDLVVEELDDELLVYDVTVDRAALPERSRGARLASLRWQDQR